MQAPSISSKFLDHIFDRRVLLHILFWVGIIVFDLVVFHRGDDAYLHTLINTLGFLPGHIIFTYAIIYLLIPRFIFKRKLFGSIIWSILILLISLLYMKTAGIYLHYSRYKSLLDGLGDAEPRIFLALFSTLGPAVTIKLVKTWYQEKEVQRQLEREKLTAELNSLKAQLHPHFLFNTLNNIYALSLEQSMQAPPAILKLSALLRYILYECNENETPLQREISILKDYTELEQMRYGERLDLSFHFSGNLEGKMIVPLLLLPFVENAFKHGTSQELEQCWIMLDLRVDGNNLNVKLSNSRHPQEKDPARATGIGLQHVRKRLNLLYPGRHSLQVTADEDTFTISLLIQLSVIQLSSRPAKHVAGSKIAPSSQIVTGSQIVASSQKVPGTPIIKPHEV